MIIAVGIMVLTMSIAGSLLACIMLAGERLWGRKISPAWQYYLWLVVVVRFLIPWSFAAPEPALYSSAQLQTEAQPADLTETSAAQGTAGAFELAAAWMAAGSSASQADAAALVVQILTLTWAAVALGLFVHRITACTSYLRCLRAGLEPVADDRILNRTAELAERVGIRRPVEIGINPLAPSPMMIGWRRPCIVLPEMPRTEDQLEAIVLHELIHWNRHDQAYKWMVQAAVCLHWFNPLVYLMSRRIARLCELACDRRVMQILGRCSAAAYGEALLDSMGGVHSCRAAAGTLEMSGNKRLLKERLEQMEEHTKRKPGALALAIMLSVVLLCSAACTRVYVPVDGRWHAAPVTAGSFSRAVWTDEGDPDLVIRAEHAWIELEPSDAVRAETSYDAEYYTVRVTEEDGRTEVVCEGRSLRDMRNHHVTVGVPRSVDRLRIEAVESLVTGQAEAPVQNVTLQDSAAQMTVPEEVQQAAVSADNALLQLLSPDDFADTEIRLHLSETLLTTSDALRSRVQRSGDDAVLPCDVPKSQISVRVSQGVVLLDTGEQQAAALLQAMESWDSWQAAGGSLESLPPLPELTAAQKQDPAETQPQETQPVSAPPYGLVRGILSEVGAGVGDILSAVGDEVRSALSETGSEVRSEIRAELRSALRDGG